MARRKINMLPADQKLKPSEAKPTKAIKVYWWMDSTDDLYAGYLDYVKGDDAFFVGGGHNPLKSCFLSVEQALHFSDPEHLVKYVDPIARARKIVKKANQRLRAIEKELVRNAKN